jgi:hypothetical protein
MNILYSLINFLRTCIIHFSFLYPEMRKFPFFTQYTKTLSQWHYKIFRKEKETTFNAWLCCSHVVFLNVRKQTESSSGIYIY